MIKDSKIIGTKIVAPFSWKKFKVGELFDVKSTRALNFDELESSGDYPYVVRSAERNGIRDYMTGPLDFLNKGHCITLGIDTASYFYQSCDYFFAGVKVKALYLKSYNLNMNIALYLISVLSKQVSGYGYTGGKSFSVQEFSSEFLDLPVMSSGQPDFAWMAQYMKLVQDYYLKQKELSNQAEIKAYLTEGHTNSLKITDADRQFLRDFEKLPRRGFKVGELFDVKSTRALNFNELESSGDYPYVVRSAERNGIRDYMIGPLDFLNEGNCITLGIDTASYFYQSCDYFFAGVKVKALYLKTYKLNMNIALYLISVLSKQVSGYGYVGGKSFSVQEFSSEYLELPALSESQVDFESIEKYMQIQSKSLINKVAEALAPVGRRC